MAWNVQNIQEQVQLQTGYNGLNAVVLAWVNRTLMDISIRAHWPKNLTVLNQLTNTTATNTTVVSSQWVSLSVASASNPINILQAEMVQGTNALTAIQPLVRHEPQELYNYFQGSTANFSSATASMYAVVDWQSATSGAVTQNYMVPRVAFFPLIATTATTAHASWTMLQAPNILTAATGTNGGESLWIMQQYFHVVLAGVMRHAMIYIGDYNRYMIEKGEFENGIRDMIMNELTTLAATPIRRAIYPESVYRDQQGGA